MKPWLSTIHSHIWTTRCTQESLSSGQEPVCCVSYRLCQARVCVKPGPVCLHGKTEGRVQGKNKRCSNWSCNLLEVSWESITCTGFSSSFMHIVSLWSQVIYTDNSLLNFILCAHYCRFQHWSDFIFCKSPAGFSMLLAYRNPFNLFSHLF